MNQPLPTGDERDFEALRRAQRAHEPSMEEILASIRAIIADDREAPAAAKPTAPTGPQIVYSNDSPAVSARNAAAPVVVIAPAPHTEPAPSAPSRQPAPTELTAPTPAPEQQAPTASEPEDEAGEPPLLSEEADYAVAASFEALSASVAARSAELIDQMTREMLRPMIKGWLDEHLPSMVERLVRSEIQRVARGQR